MSVTTDITALKSAVPAPGDLVLTAIQTVVTSSARQGYLPATNVAVSRTTYARLFAAIGTTFGPGDGSTTFGLPNIAPPVANTRWMVRT